MGREGGEEGGEYSTGESIEIPLSLTLGFLVREYLYEEEAACSRFTLFLNEHFNAVRTTIILRYVACLLMKSVITVICS